MTSSNIIQLYIPRINDESRTITFPLPETIVYIINTMQIGKIVYLDIHRQIDDTGSIYYFVLLDIEPSDNIYSHYFINTLVKDGQYQFDYENEIWIVKLYTIDDKCSSVYNNQPNKQTNQLWREYTLWNKTYELIENLPNFL